MNNIAEILFSLIGYEVFGQEISSEIRSKITPEILPKLYKLSKKHDLAHLISDALYKNGYDFSKEEYYAKFQTEQIAAIYRYQQQNFELQRVCALLEENQIPFIPLKGSVIREYYPQPWMRTSCDVDILVKEQDLERACKLLTEKLRYKAYLKSTHDVTLFSENNMCLELHFELNESDFRIFDILTKPWENSHIKEGKKFEHLLNSDFFILYHIIHMAKHFSIGGCGVKPLVDLLLLKNNGFYVHTDVVKICKDSGLDKFFEKMLEMTDIWFNNGIHNTSTLNLQEYILTGGVYGNKVNRMVVSQNNKGGKIGLIFFRLFPPTEYLQKQFKKSEIKKWQYPYFAFKRMLRLLDKEKYNKISNELSVSKSVTKSEADKVSDILDYIGL